MKLSILKLSLGALKENKARSILTTLGIIIGTAIVIIVLSVGASIEALILEQVSTITPESIYVEVQVPSKGSYMQKNINTAQQIGSGVQITTLTLDDLEDIKKIDNVEAGFGWNIGQEKFTHRGNEKNVMVYAVGTDYREMEELNIAQGRFFTQQEDDSLAQVVVLGSEVKEILFGTEDALNKNVKVNQQNYRVVGVAEEIGTRYFMNVDEIVYMPVKTAQKKLMGIDHVVAMGVMLKDQNYYEQTVDQITRILRKNHNIQDPEKDDFAVRTRDEALDILSTVTTSISILLLSIALISLIVGGVGIMNVMYVAVTERIHEIGLKKAIGAKPSAIRFQFMSEAVIVAIIGGLIGIFTGISISALISYLAGVFGYSWPFVMSTGIIVFSVAIPILIGIIFGYAPAQKAALLNPIEALKHA